AGEGGPAAHRQADAGTPSGGDRRAALDRGGGRRHRGRVLHHAPLRARSSRLGRRVVPKAGGGDRMTALAGLAARRPKRILAAALVLAVVAGVFGFGVASQLGPYGADDPATDSVKTSNALERATGLTTSDSLRRLVRPATSPQIASVTSTLRTDR